MLPKVQSASRLLSRIVDCQSGKQKQKNKPVAILDSWPRDRFVFLLLILTPTVLFSLDHERRSRKRNESNETETF